MVAGFILEFLLLLVSMGLMLASCVEKSWNMAMIAYVLCALAAAIISALWSAMVGTVLLVNILRITTWASRMMKS